LDIIKFDYVTLN